MPSLIGISDFIDETREDYNSPTTSTFVSRIPQCRQTLNTLEEILDVDREGLGKLKKAIKSIHNSGNAHVDNEMYLSRALERLGNNAIINDQEPEIGAAFFKFAVVTKELSALMKTLMQNINNIVLFPVDSLLKGDLRGVKGDLKRPFEKASKDYESKYQKIEKEKKSQAKEAGLIRTEVTSAEIADEMEKERRLFQLQMCEVGEKWIGEVTFQPSLELPPTTSTKYLIKFNEIKMKKSIELLQHLVEYYHAQTNYFQDGLKTIEHFGGYVADLSVHLQNIKQQQDEERKRLIELRNMLRAATPHENQSAAATGGYSLHQIQGDKQLGVTKTGYLLKKSEGKVRRVWQKRKCRVCAEGFLDVFHADLSKAPARLNLLTCQLKHVSDDRRAFDLVSYNRTYHFQAEEEMEQRAWMSVLSNCKETALMRAFHQQTEDEEPAAHSLLDLQRAIIHAVRSLPGNQNCCDCGSTNDPTWLSTNFGVIVCIECSGIHRELGVHISRIQSLTLDRLTTSQLLLARHMGNHTFNEIMERNLHPADKLTPESNMEQRTRFIRDKYVSRKWAARTCVDQIEAKADLEHAVNNGHLANLLQAFADGADLVAALPYSDCGETALHLAIAREPGDGSRLHLVDFLIQNGGPQLLDKPTMTGITPLHLCAATEKPEAMKLLLRAGADPTITDKNGRTPLQIAKQLAHRQCQELLESLERREKSILENVNVDWNLSHDDASTDFSDDDTVVVEERNGLSCVRSRPSSLAEESMHATLPRRPLDHVKKRAPPPPPVVTLAQSLPLIMPRASIGSSNAARPQVPPPTPPLVPVQFQQTHHFTLSNGGNARKECSSQESSLELCDISDVSTDDVAPRNQSALSYEGHAEANRLSDPRLGGPSENESRRKNNLNLDDDSVSVSSMPNTVPTYTSLRRCRALYNCDADNEDELSFHEGDIIVVVNDRTDDENWMEGFLPRTRKRGVFPASFVHMLPD